MLLYLSACPRKEFNEGLQAIVRVTSGAGRRVAGPDDVVEGWGKLTTNFTILDSPNQRGRYVVVESHHRRAILDFQNSARAVPFTTGDKDYGCEINLNSLQLTMKSNHLEVNVHCRRRSFFPRFCANVHSCAKLAIFANFKEFFSDFLFKRKLRSCSKKMKSFLRHY